MEVKKKKKWLIMSGTDILAKRKRWEQSSKFHAGFQTTEGKAFKHLGKADRLEQVS